MCQLQLVGGRSMPAATTHILPLHVYHQCQMYTLILNSAWECCASEFDFIDEQLNDVVTKLQMGLVE